jgi:membrane-associated phospholipid phosphatase
MPRLLLTRRLLLGCAALSAAAAAALAASGLDASVFLAINAAAARGLPAPVPSCLTILGHGLVAVMLLAPLQGRAPAVLAAALYGAPVAALFSRLGKWLVARPRPAAVLDPALMHIQGPVLSGHNSFPSGHSITIFLVATVVVLGVPAVRDRAARAASVLALAGLVAASRVMVGAHWPSDALAGAALGMVAGVAGGWAAGRWPLWERRGAPIVLGLVVLACAAILFGVDTGYPLAQPLQWVAGALGLVSAARALAGARRQGASNA